MSESWRVNDPEWLAERKSEWRIIRKNLEQTEDFNVKQIRALEKYFLTGKESDDITFNYKYYEEVHNIPLIFKLWFHPDRSEDNWGRLCDDITERDYRVSLMILKGCSLVYGKPYPPDEYIGGLERRVFEFLHGNGRGIRTVRDDYGHTTKLDISKHRISLDGLTTMMFSWLYGGSNPYAICQYMTDWWFEEIENADDKWFARNKTKLKKFLIRLLIFVEPSGLSGEDLQYKCFADKFREMLNTRKLPEGLRRIWDSVQKPEERNLWIKRVIDEECNSFEVYLIYSKGLLSNAIERIVSIAYELGFTDRKYTPESVERVDFSNSLRNDFKCLLLGYSRSDRVPAFRYSMPGTSKLTDTEEPCISFDLLQLCNAPALEKQDHAVPVFVWLPRPDKPYNMHDDPGRMTFWMNMRLLQRTILAKTGLELQEATYEDKPYFELQDLAESEDSELQKATDKPYPEKMMPILNKPEYDFPIWKE